jgi:large subunit ribosomal protein L24
LVSENDRKWLGEAEIPSGGQLQPMFIPMKNVRLVIHRDGRDIIVDRMVVQKEKHESGNDIIRRRIPGTHDDIDEGIDLVTKEENEDWDTEPLVSDTFSTDVESSTWTLTLEQPPLPPTLIDELRNKYSKARTRHEDSYVQKLLTQDEKTALKPKVGKIMLRTPGKEFSIQQRTQARATASRKKISPQSWELLGQFMAKNLDVSQQNKLLQSLPKESK